MESLCSQIKLCTTKTWNIPDFDSIVLVTSDLTKLQTEFPDLHSVAANHLELDKTAAGEPTLIVSSALKPKRIVLCYTGPELSDYDDVRLFYDITLKGVLRAAKAGSLSPVLICQPDYFDYAFEVSLLAAMDAVYLPIEARTPEKVHRVNKLTAYMSDNQNAAVINRVQALNDGKTVMKDIGGGEPELMAPPRVREYVLKLFDNDPSVKVTCINDDRVLDEDYPLFSAVNRGARKIDRHQGCILKLDYVGKGEIERDLFLVGKGITFDTGGVDLKVHGMRHMSFDKCGAACIAGFYEILRKVRPEGLRVTSYMAMARNNIGEEAYVCDEIITAASGVKICVGNTDAEGRMVLADPLYHSKILAESCKNAYIFTIATLTGHVGIVYGAGYTAILENSTAAKKNIGHLMKRAGTAVGDPVEISFLRREDFKFITYRGDKADILQCNDLPSSRTPRGHNFPAAFLMRLSRLVDNGASSKIPVAYCHLDIASGVDQSSVNLDHPRAASLSALAYIFIFKEFT